MGWGWGIESAAGSGGGVVLTQGGGSASHKEIIFGQMLVGSECSHWVGLVRTIQADGPVGTQLGGGGAVQAE